MALGLPSGISPPPNHQSRALVETMAKRFAYDQMCCCWCWWALDRSGLALITKAWSSQVCVMCVVAGTSECVVRITKARSSQVCVVCVVGTSGGVLCIYMEGHVFEFNAHRPLREFCQFYA
jgi:hypothetical protein